MKEAEKRGEGRATKRCGQMTDGKQMSSRVGVTSKRLRLCCWICCGVVTCVVGSRLAADSVVVPAKSRTCVCLSGWLTVEGIADDSVK